MTGSTSPRNRRSRLLLLLVAAFSPALAGCPPQSGGLKLPLIGNSGIEPLPIFKVPEPAAPDPASVWPPRAVWVVRQEWKSPDEIVALMENVRRAGFNTVLFQVRGNATVYYRSSIEPFAYNDPGFDPLEIACREAHRRGLALQAWVNVMPGWKPPSGAGPVPPTDQRQLYNAHPEWFWYDQRGQRQPINPSFYVSVNPCLPEVRQHIVSVLAEIVRGYPVDGLQMDYIRFPSDESPKGSDYPYDAKTLSLYRQSTGKRPQDDKAAWTNWRIRQVTQLVREIRQLTNSAGRTVRLTASCGADFKRWRPDHFQDGPTWLREKLVDCIFVMNYTADIMTFVRRQEAWQQAAPGCWVAAGIEVGGGRQPKPVATVIEQLKLAAQWRHGFCLFAASSLFGDSPQARQRLEALRPILLSMQLRPAAMSVPPARPQLARTE